MQIDLFRRLWQAGERATTNFLVQLNQALSTQASAIELRGRSSMDFNFMPGVYRLNLYGSTGTGTCTGA
jgi:hypothetical protein